MPRFSTIIVLALSTLLLVSIGVAQQTSVTAVPNLIRYSGTLKDAPGPVPSATPLGVTFAIYKQQDGGAPVWQETQNVTPDTSGQYSVVLGSTTAAGLPDDLCLPTGAALAGRAGAGTSRAGACAIGERALRLQSARG